MGLKRTAHEKDTPNLLYYQYESTFHLLLGGGQNAGGPDRPTGPRFNQEYQIQIGDALDIKFFYHPELNESVMVRPDGRISLQLVHEVQASGLTPEQLRQNLRKKYEPQISQPEIAVIVRSFTAQKVYVDGEVAKPGLVPLTGP